MNFFTNGKPGLKREEQQQLEQIEKEAAPLLESIQAIKTRLPQSGSERESKLAELAQKYANQPSEENLRQYLETATLDRHHPEQATVPLLQALEAKVQEIRLRAHPILKGFYLRVSDTVKKSFDSARQEDEARAKKYGTPVEYSLAAAALNERWQQYAEKAEAANYAPWRVELAAFL